MITQNELQELFEYKDGSLWSRDLTRSRSKKPASILRIDGKSYRVPKLIFLFHNGYLPTVHLHHLNGNSKDNRIENLVPLSKPVLSASSLRELVEYREGNLYWKKPLSGRTQVGSRVGHTTQAGYGLARIGNRLTKLHHLIFLYHHGFMPKMIDHINGDPSDNRIENLHECDVFGNARNCRKKQTTATSQFKGVSWIHSKNKWRAAITVNRQSIHLGYFLSETDAAKAYDVAASHYFKEYACYNFKVK